ncbi:hypothetical protein FRC10_011404 [Ceratobasidium sp. 414]|nr:hypothetical protein FRC10_011404 [Ceratobasidium sp. 414]
MSARSAPQHLVSGAMSGLCSSLALQPLDLLKTRLQQGARGLGGIFTIARNVIAQNGVIGLWRGTAPTVASDKGSTLPKLSTRANLVSGACTRVAVGFLLNPLAILKARFESGAFAYTSIPHGFASLVQTHGVRGLWQGFLLSVFRDAPYAGLFVASYEAAKTYGVVIRIQLRAAEIMFDTSAPGTAVVAHSSAGMFAGAFATFATHPFDMVKESGLLGFFSDTSLRMSRKVRSSAIGWTVYEAMLLAFQKRDEMIQLRQKDEQRAGVVVGVSA